MSIWGSPGFGKTSVAIAVGHSLQSRGFPVYLISLRGLHSKDDLTSKFLSVFRKPIINGQSFHQSVSLDYELRQLFSVISNRSVFILDDADDLLEGGSPKVKEEVALLLEELQNQGVAFLLITREPFKFLDKRFAGHRDFRIGPLDEPSAQSLVYKLLPGTTAPDCVRITQTCGQVPLALKSMCSLIRDGSTQPHQFLDGFVTSLMGNMENIMDNLEYATSHRRRLKSIFEFSYQRLSKKEKEALISESIFPANFRTEDVEAVFGFTESFEARKVLQSLRRKTLIDFSPKHQSFTMHKLLQSFARRKKDMSERNPHSQIRRKFDTSTKLMRDEHRGTKDCYCSLAIIQSEINDFPSAPHSHQRANKQSGEHQASTAVCYHLDNTQNSMDKISSAVDFDQRGIDIWLGLLGEKHSITADSYFFLGNAQHEMNCFTSALESLNRAFEIRVELLGEEHPSTADSYYSLGKTQYKMNHLTSALQYYQRALDTFGKLFGENSEGTSDNCYSLGIIQCEMGDFRLAQRSHQHSLEIRLNLSGEDHRKTADDYRELGLTSAHQNDYDSVVQSMSLSILLKLLSFLSYCRRTNKPNFVLDSE